MKKLILLLTLFLNALCILSPAQAIQWQKSLGGSEDDHCYVVKQTSDGGYISGGISYSSDGDVTGMHGNTGFLKYADYWVVKLDNIGNLQWQKSLGGTDDDYLASIQQTSDGGYIVGGYSISNNGDIIGHNGNFDYWVVKIDGTGNIQWQKSLGGTQSDIATDIRQTSDGGYIIAGDSESNDGNVAGNHGSSDYWIVKLDGSGNVQWQKSLGGSDDESVTSIQQTSDGGYIIAGDSKSIDGDVIGHHGTNLYSDYWVVKIDASGAIQWQQSLGGTSEESLASIQQTIDGGYVVGGSSSSNDGDVTGHHGAVFSEDYWIVKIDASGVLQWQKSLGGTDAEYLTNIQQTSDGGYIIGGSSVSNDGDVTGHHGQVGGYYYDYWIIKLDAIGTIQWQKSLGGTEVESLVSLRQTSDGGYIVGGNSQSYDYDVTGHHGTGSYADYWIVKLNTSGIIQWQTSLGGTYNENFSSIQQTTDGGYIVAGEAFSNDGDVTENHGLYSDYWIVKLSATSDIHDFSIESSEMHIYPNPNNGTFTLETKAEGTYSIINELGQTIQQIKLNGANNYTFTIDNLSTGIYFVVGYNNDQISRQKVVVTQ